MLVLNETPSEEMYCQGGKGVEEPGELTMRSEHNVAAVMAGGCKVMIVG